MCRAARACSKGRVRAAGEMTPGTRGALRVLALASAGNQCLQGPRGALRGLTVAGAGDRCLQGPMILH